MNTVICQITGEGTDGDSCYCTVLVVDGEAPETTLPEGIKLTDESRKRCLSCQYHEDK